MRTPTDSQWQAIRACDRHTLVVAGAGTGKTSTVVGRILYLLGVEVRGATCPAPLELCDIGAITYTNAAAADLKTKLREELRRLGRRELAYEVDGARIGTIHGFCGDVLREFALRLGRAPDLRILDEGEAAALTADAVHDTVLDALEHGTVGGLDALFAAWPVSEVESWLGRLSGDSVRLERLRGGHDRLGAVERTVVELAELARQGIERRLHETGAVDFERMITWTRDLLRRDAPARRLLQHRLRVLIVDEFQDVDPVQKEIAYLLGEPASGRADTTRLMLVGDPKQSIYRFRRADVTVWREVQEDFAVRGHGDVVALAENFRSVAPVLAFVDATVGRILDAPIDGERLRDFEVPFHPVSATRQAGGAAGGDPAIELSLVAPPEGTRVTADEVRAAEGRAIATRAWELHRSGIAWKEMALLVPTWGSLTRYEAALRQAGIPTYALRGEGFYERREVLDLVLALETLRDPRDDRALLGFLRSPFVGLRDETLLSIAWQADQPYWDYLHVVDVAGTERALLDRGLALLGEHVALRDRVPADSLLESLLDRSGYLAHLYALGTAADQAIANVRKFLRIARQAQGHGVGDLLRSIRERRERGDRDGDARLYSQGEDVLTITSVHSAKGLEWRVVFWGDMVWAPQRFGGNILVGRDGIALKDPELGADEQPLHWRRLLQDEEAEQLAERKRLWYVAATRAKDRLIISGLCPAKKDGKSTGAALLQALGAAAEGVEAAEDGVRVEYAGHDGARFVCAVRVTPVGTLAEPSSSVGHTAPGHPDTVDEPQPGHVPRALPDLAPPLEAAAGQTRHSATELLAYARCPRRHWFRYVAGLREPEAEPAGGGSGPATTRGQIVHDVLEHLTAETDCDALLDAAVGRWDPDAPAPEAARPESGAPRSGAGYRDELKAEIEAVASHPGYRAITDLPTARRELPFLHILGSDSFTEGRIDLAACRDGELVALDVKTGNDTAEAAARKAEAYRVQGRVYAAALVAISGMSLRCFGFHFSGAGVQVFQEVDGAARAVDQIQGILDDVGQGRAALTRDPSHCRRCGYRGAGWCEGVTLP